jgi:hypothetical protein
MYYYEVHTKGLGAKLYSRNKTHVLHMFKKKLNWTERRIYPERNSGIRDMYTGRNRLTGRDSSEGNVY